VKTWNPATPASRGERYVNKGLILKSQDESCLVMQGKNAGVSHALVLEETEREDTG
jgi:hypothetical protein